MAGAARRGRSTGGDRELLLGACFQQGFLAAFAGELPAEAELADLARRLVATVLGAR